MRKFLCMGSARADRDPVGSLRAKEAAPVGVRTPQSFEADLAAPGRCTSDVHAVAGDGAAAQ